MTIDEAIRILKVMEEDCDRLNEPFSKEAIKLGIEALERVKWHRNYLLKHYVDKLPGETEE